MANLLCPTGDIVIIFTFNATFILHTHDGFIRYYYYYYRVNFLNGHGNGKLHYSDYKWILSNMEIALISSPAQSPRRSFVHCRANSFKSCSRVEPVGVGCELEQTEQLNENPKLMAYDNLFSKNKRRVEWINIKRDTAFEGI